MLIRKQNRTLVFVSLVILVLLVFLLQQAGVIGESRKQNVVDIRNEVNAPAIVIDQEQMGEAIKDGDQSSGERVDEKLFGLIMNDLVACFENNSSSMPDKIPAKIESLFSALQADWGPVMTHSDRWMNWHLKNKENVQHRLRLEITEADDGRVHRELKYYAVDREELPVPVPLPAEKRDNPTDELVNQMLKEGEVFYKEKAAYALFAGGSRLEYVEKNGELAELEVQRGDRYFRCQNFRVRDACQCIR